jgi:DNA repair ATPase RecN
VKKSLIAAVALLVILLAGCGSSKSTTSSATASGSASATSSATTSSARPSSSTTATGTGAPVSAFKADLLRDKAQFTAFGASLQKALLGAGSKTDAQLADELSALSDKAKAQAQRLSQLNPPAKYKTTVDNLVTYVTKVGADLKQISQAAVNHDAAAAKTATKQLIQDATKVKAADTALTTGLGLPTQ